MTKDNGRYRAADRVLIGRFAALALCGIMGLPGCSGAVDLKKGIQVTGAVEPGIYSLYPQLDSREWKIRLNVLNATGGNIGLGQDLILVENDAAGTAIMGVYHSRGRAPEGPEEPGGILGDHHWASEYGVANFNLQWADGAMNSYRDPGRYEFRKKGDWSRETHPEKLTFGSLPTGQTRKLELELEEGTWLKPADGLRIALPVLIVKTGAKEDRFRLVVYFKKPIDPEKQPWTVARTEVIPLVPAGLVAQLKRSDLDIVARIFAANWLMEADPKQGSGQIAEVAKALPGGPLLTSCLQLLASPAAVSDGALAPRALELLSDKQTPEETRCAAAVYLGHAHYQAAGDALKAATGYHLSACTKRALQELNGTESQPK